ncbi:MAG: ABC transporter substrate-binding protein [Desulfonatronovibrionaceae bacterium]
MKRIIFVLLAGVFLCSGLLTSVGYCAGEKEITVGSKIDTEGALLGQMMVLLLEKNGYEVEDKTEFGPTPIVRKAIISGEIDIYPEYTGNGAFFFDREESELWKDFDQGYARVKELDQKENGLVWLTPAPADNTWALAVRGELAEKEGLDTLEDLAGYVNSGGETKLAACEEFVTRKDALPSFEKAYGFNIPDEDMVVFSGCNTAQTEKAAARGTSGVNIAMAFGTDGALSALGLKLLRDTKGVQPVYAPAPVVREEIWAEHKELDDLLAPVFRSLDQKVLQELNSRIAIGGENAARVAEHYLRQKGFI